MSELLHRTFAAQAERRPGAVALVHRVARISYGELEAISNRIARGLRSAGVRNGDRVCLLLPKEPRAIAALLGVLKAGAVYVPIDPDCPPARSRGLIESCDTRWILGSAARADAARALFEDRGFAARHVMSWVDGGTVDEMPVAFRWSDVESEPADSMSCEGSPDAPAYILFTSGSTGTPKGVVITHANVVAFLSWALPYFGMGPDDRISGHPPLHFDLSVFDTFGALTSGAQLHLVPTELNLLTARMVRFMAEESLTQWFSVPSVLNLVAKFDLLATRPLPSMRRVLWCGEVLPTSTLRYWMSHVPHARFTNLYGPTEATIASSYYAVPGCPASDTERVPIGAACGGEELLVLDAALKPVAPGMTGELFIAGAGLSPGYWRDAERTALAFLPDPRPDRNGGRVYRTGDLARLGPDGLLYFVGRADTQIKSRGYRIELGEIEAALAAEPGLREGAVIAVPSGGFEGMAICCAFVPVVGGLVSAPQLRTSLQQRLPSYMLPTRWKELPRLPRNANGKIDRKLLEQEFAAAGASEAA